MSVSETMELPRMTVEAAAESLKRAFVASWNGRITPIGTSLSVEVVEQYSKESPAADFYRHEFDTIERTIRKWKKDHAWTGTVSALLSVSDNGGVVFSFSELVQ